MRFADKAFLITGGASGIGRATAERIGADGGRVAIVDRNPETLAEALAALPDGSMALEADVGDEGAARWAVGEAVERLGRLDGLVTSAGIAGGDDIKPVHEVPFEEFHRILRVNLDGTFLFTKHALPHLMASGGGSVVAISSSAALHGSAMGSGYTASKGGVSAFMRLVAVQYGPHGIRANSVCPGGIDTPMTGGRFGSEPGVAVPAERAVPLGRWGAAADVGDVVTFLLSDDSRYVSGQTIAIDGARGVVT
jgi:NAD(P)-dependent dehydrogenase (short-subunit alcohol dehydrogenase family)